MCFWLAHVFTIFHSSYHIGNYIERPYFVTTCTHTHTSVRVCTHKHWLWHWWADFRNELCDFIPYCWIGRTQISSQVHYCSGQHSIFNILSDFMAKTLLTKWYVFDVAVNSTIRTVHFPLANEKKTVITLMRIYWKYFSFLSKLIKIVITFSQMLLVVNDMLVIPDVIWPLIEIYCIQFTRPVRFFVSTLSDVISSSNYKRKISRNFSWIVITNWI